VVELVCQTFLIGMFFGNYPQNFHTLTGQLWKVVKAQKFALPLFEAQVSARVGLAFVADQTSACRFAYTFPSCNPQCFKYSWKFCVTLYTIPITPYSLRFMIHAKTKPNNSLSGAAFSWAFFFWFVAYQPHQFCQISCANHQQVENLKQLAHCSLLGKFPTHQSLGLCCIYCVFVPFRIETY